MILIGTDFSRGSLHATRIALVLARKTDSKVLLLHAFKSQSRSGMFLSMDRYIRQAAEMDMVDFVDQIEPELQAYISETLIVRGFAEEVIMQYDGQEDIGLVVVGTQGSSAIREIFMGRTANILLNKLQSPILAVPEESDDQPPQRLIFAWDGQHMEQSDIDRLIEWAGKLQVELEVMHVHTAEAAPCDEAVIAGFKDRGVEINIIPGVDDVKDEIDDYLNQFEHTWLCLIKRERGFFEPFFHDSMVKRELFSTTSPILII